MKVFIKPPGKKTHACFTRIYDANHLAHHPKQKVADMQLLMTAEIRDGDTAMCYSFPLGVSYRHRSGDFDSSGTSEQAFTLLLAEDAGHDIRLTCPVDCEGGGIEVALSRDDKSTIVRLRRITARQRNKPNDQAANVLVAGARIFLLDRAAPKQCVGPVADRKELAAIRHKC
jgi:hypothetical protein